MTATLKRFKLADGPFNTLRNLVDLVIGRTFSRFELLASPTLTTPCATAGSFGICTSGSTYTIPTVLPHFVQ